jgi:hypothetical protein
MGIYPSVFPGVTRKAALLSAGFFFWADRRPPPPTNADVIGIRHLDP